MSAESVRAWFGKRLPQVARNSRTALSRREVRALRLKCAEISGALSALWPGVGAEVAALAPLPPEALVVVELKLPPGKLRLIFGPEALAALLALRSGEAPSRVLLPPERVDELLLGVSVLQALTVCAEKLQTEVFLAGICQAPRGPVDALLQIKFGAKAASWPVWIELSPEIRRALRTEAADLPLEASELSRLSAAKTRGTFSCNLQLSSLALVAELKAGARLAFDPAAVVRAQLGAGAKVLSLKLDELSPGRLAGSIS